MICQGYCGRKDDTIQEQSDTKQTVMMGNQQLASREVPTRSTYLPLKEMNSYRFLRRRGEARCGDAIISHHVTLVQREDTKNHPSTHVFAKPCFCVISGLSLTMDGFCKLSNQVPHYLLGFGEIKALHILKVILKHRIIQLIIGFKMIDTEITNYWL